MALLTLVVVVARAAAMTAAVGGTVGGVITGAVGGVFTATEAGADTNYKAERLHLSTDRTCYHAGDRVWFRAFMVDVATHRPITQSRYVYVELLGEDATALEHTMVMERDGVFCGYIDVPSGVLPGKYYLRSFTRLNANRPDLENIVPIVIGDDDTPLRSLEPRASYSPEVLAEPHGDSTLVSIVLPPECAAQWASMVVSVTADSVVGRIPIGYTIARDTMPGVPLVDEPEQSQRITGRAEAMHGSKFGGIANVSLLAPQSDFFLTTRTDGSGNFSFDGIELADSTMLIVQAVDDRDHASLLLSINPVETPPCRYPVTLTDADYHDYVVPESHILLKEVVVRGRYNLTVERDAFSSIADESLSLERLERIDATCLHDVFRRIAGVYLTNDERVIIRGRTSIYGDSYAAIAVDGVIVPEEFDLHSIHMKDVERVDVFKSGSSMIWGADGGRGVISITTKNPYTGPKSKLSPNIKKIFATGYQQHKPFRPSDKTLYWNPAVRTRGNDVLLVEIAKTKQFSVTIEGLTDDGKTIYTTTDFVGK